jgi:uncharacterized membrane protein
MRRRTADEVEYGLYLAGVLQSFSALLGVLAPVVGRPGSEACP